MDDMPVKEGVKLFADLNFAHMTIDAGESKYYRDTSPMYPKSAQYKKEEIWSYSIVWNVPKNQCGGSFSVSIEMINFANLMMKVLRFMQRLMN